jgi:predicted esterase
MQINPALTSVFAPVVYSDLPLPTAVEWTSKFVEHSSVSFDGKLTYPAYKYIPVTYLVCEDDKVISPEMQRSMIEAAKEDGLEIDVRTCSAGHGVNVSATEELVKVIRAAAEEKV